jgi:23S rRNA pseudouridine2605 synthase
MAGEDEKTIRIQRFLAMCGVASRRQAEELIRQQRVEINDRVARIGDVVEKDKDVVRVDGARIKPRTHLSYFAWFKPKKTLCSRRDDRGRPTIYAVLPQKFMGFNYVGRLDYNSEGLLLLMDDGELKHRLEDPKNRIERVYHVKVQGMVPERLWKKLEKGVKTKDGEVLKASKIKVLRGTKKNMWFVVTLLEGRYREVRRLFETINYNVLKLRRVRFGPILLGKMKVGELRPLTQVEVEALKKACGLSS